MTKAVVFVRLGLGVLLLSLGGCVYHTHPICLPEFRRDIPNLEGAYVFRFMDGALNLQSVQVSIVREGVGLYHMSPSSVEPMDNTSVTTCEVDGTYFVESHNAKTEQGTHYFTSSLQLQSNGTIDIGVLGVDRLLLDDQHIPYTAEKLVEGGGIVFRGPSEGKVLVVQNGSIDSLTMAQVLHPLSIKFTLVPVMALD